MNSSVLGLAFPSGVMPAAGLTTGSKVAQGATAAPAVSFESIMKDIAGDVSDKLRTAETASVLGVRGQLPAQDVVQAIMTAEQTLQTTISVRDKLVAAYNDLTRMQI